MKKKQKAYAGMLEERAEGEYDAFERGIFQVDLPDFNRSDRCISCHHGLEDPAMKQMPQPHKIHPGDFLKDHPQRDIQTSEGTLTLRVPAEDVKIVLGKDL